MGSYGLPNVAIARVHSSRAESRDPTFSEATLDIHGEAVHMAKQNVRV